MVEKIFTSVKRERADNIRCQGEWREEKARMLRQDFELDGRKSRKLDREAFICISGYSYRASEEEAGDVAILLPKQGIATETFS